MLPLVRDNVYKPNWSDYKDHVFNSRLLRSRFMQITTSGHQLELTSAIKDYVQNKLQKLEKHHDRITSINVILSVDKLEQKAEATIHVSGKEFFANCTSEDLYAAIDLLSDKLDRQLIKHKEKMRSHRWNQTLFLLVFRHI